MRFVAGIEVALANTARHCPASLPLAQARVSAERLKPCKFDYNEIA